MSAENMAYQGKLKNICQHYAVINDLAMRAKPEYEKTNRNVHGILWVLLVYVLYYMIL